MKERTPLTIDGQSGTARHAMESGVEAAASLYVHVPFCVHKCHYCDFYSVSGADDRHDAFLDALEAELRALERFAAPLETVFFGGGTPTLLSPVRMRRLLDALHTGYDLAPILAGRGEFTVECNPETATPELLRVLKAGGVDRLSVGAQSFDPATLRTLERRHEPRRVGEALAMAAEAGIERLSVDLIFAVPGQTVAAWERDLEAALSLSPAPGHVSCYCLTYEPNTALTRRVERGEFAPVHEDVEAEMYETAVRRLSEAGYARYEVSNFARPGAGGGASLHNLAYWRQRSWLAAGPSASAHLRCAHGGWRWRNAPRLTDWMESVAASGGYSVVEDLEAPDARRALCERIMTGLRLAEGVEWDGLLAGARALDAGAALERAVGAHERAGLLLREGGALRLTERGFLMADGVAAALMRAVAP